MATSGNIDRALASWLTMRINWVVNSQDVSTNKSNVTVKVQLITGNGNISSSASKAIKVSINGTTYDSTTTIGIAKNTTKTLYTKTLDIAHNSDGTKELALNCTLTFDATISGTWWGDRYLGGTASLNTIARASSFTRTGTAIMGNAQTIKITRKNSSFTHTLKYTWGGTTTTIVSKTTATSYTWTPAVSMATSIPNASSGTCKLTCETYNGSTLIGTDTLSFTLSVPDTVVPTISAFTHSEAVVSIANNFGFYVDTKSKITYAVTAAGAQGSTIKSYSVSIAGQKFTAASGTTKAINVGLTETGDSVSGKEYKATATVTDSRGRTATKEITITVYKYTPPTITGFTVKRSTSAGTANDEGTALLTSYVAKIASVYAKNSGSIKIEYKKTTDSTYTSARSISSFTGTYTENVVLSNITFATDTMYHVKITVSDLAGTTISSIYEVSTAKPMLDFKANKKGVGIGKVATDDNLLDIGYKTRFYGGIKPMVIASGTNMDTLTTPNIYASEYPANNTYYANCNLPAITSKYFTVTVEATSEYNIKQTWTSIDGTTARTWERFKGTISGTSWGAWVCTSDLGGTLLWGSTASDTGYYMTAGHTATLSEKVSAQQNGIVLVFSTITSGTVKNENFNHVFVPKKFVAIQSGMGTSCFIHDAEFANVASKRLYIYDDKITGHANNSSTATSNGIKYNNGAYVLRYVIGV